jgi:eukaryotic-like serine/threonine-protein kinase
VPLTQGLKLAQYEVIAPLGAGGMGEVYRAHDSHLKRDVAIKIMAKHVASDPEMRRRFESEARAVAALSHPSILSIFELAIVDGVPFAVMELLEGESLRARLENGRMPWREAVEIAASVAEGLAAAHVKGIIHRDLKPENLFLTKSGGVKILDFGLALHKMPMKVGSADPTFLQTSPGVVLGTFGYMSPEQVLGQAVDGRSDVFALGCVLYEMLTGTRLFTGATPQEVIANVLSDSRPELGVIDPLAPSQLSTIVASTVDRTPARRFESASDLAMALRGLLTGSARSNVARGMSRSRGKSLAVLPFTSLGTDQQIEYITDGISESIINSLSQLPGLRVVPRSVTFRYKGAQVDPTTVGLALNARTILTGRVLQQRDELNIQVELVDTATESQLWGEQFRQTTSGLMAVQEAIAWQISEALRLKLSGAQKKKLKKKTTVDPEAYQEYLRGRYHWNSWTPEGFRRALEHFERAIGHDPLYAEAWAGLGDTFGAMAYYGLANPTDAYPRARAAALKAIGLNPDLADPHATLGITSMFHDWNWNDARASFKKAIALNPKLARAQLLYALYCTATGEHEEALRLMRTARELEPLSPVINIGTAWALHFANRPQDAIRESLRVEELSPGFEEAGNLRIGCLDSLGRHGEAAEIMMRQPCWGLPLDGKALKQAFDEGGAAAYWQRKLELLNEVEEVPSAARSLQTALSLLHLGRSDEAATMLERAVEKRTGMGVFLSVDPSFAALREHPVFLALLKRIGKASA